MKPTQPSIAPPPAYGDCLGLACQPIEIPTIQVNLAHHTDTVVGKHPNGKAIADRIEQEGKPESEWPV